MSSFFNAARRGDIAVMQSMLENKQVTISDRGIDNETVLLYAARIGNLSIVKWLVNICGADTLDFDNDGKNILHHAASKGHLALVQWIIECTNVNILDKDGQYRTAMLAAAYNGELATLQWLLTHGSTINEHTSTRETALMLAVMNGKFETTKWLLKEGGALISDVTTYHMSILETAVGYNYSVILKQKFYGDNGFRRGVDWTSFIGNETMILWLLHEGYVNMNELWLALSTYEDALAMYKELGVEGLKPSLLLVSLLLISDYDQYHGKFKQLVDTARLQASILRTMNPQMERKLVVHEVLNNRLPLQMIEVVAEYSVPSLYEIWFELAPSPELAPPPDHKKKKTRCVSTTTAPRRNPERACKKRHI